MNRVAALLLAGTTVAAFLAAEAFVFGPETFVRVSGKPAKVTRTFSVANPTGPYTLRVENHGVRDAVVSMNGRIILRAKDFRRQKTQDEKQPLGDRNAKESGGLPEEADFFDHKRQRGVIAGSHRNAPELSSNAAHLHHDHPAKDRKDQ